MAEPVQSKMVVRCANVLQTGPELDVNISQVDMSDLRIKVVEVGMQTLALLERNKKRRLP